jgi:hypothetical protein
VECVPYIGPEVSPVHFILLAKVEAKVWWPTACFSARKALLRGIPTCPYFPVSWEEAITERQR